MEESDEIYMGKPYMANESFHPDAPSPQIAQATRPVMGQPVYPAYANYEGCRPNTLMSPMYYSPHPDNLIIVEDRVVIRRRRRNALLIIIIFFILFATFFSVFWFY